MYKNDFEYIPFFVDKKDKFIHLLLFLCISVFPLFPEYTWLSTIILLPGLAFFLYHRDSSIELKIDIFFRRFIIIFLFAIISFLWSFSSFEYFKVSAYFEETKKLLGVIVIFNISFFILRRNINNIWYLYLILFSKFLIMLYYTYNKGILSNFVAASGRINSGSEVGINANAYGYFAFISLFALGITINHNKNWIYKILFILVSLSSIFINTLAASRAGLFFTVLSVISIYLAVSFKSWKVLFFKIGIVLVLIAYFILSNISIFQDLLIFQRYTAFSESGEDVRVFILENGLNIVFNHPFGIGAGQFPFSMEKLLGELAVPHNCYLLIAANYGWIPLLVYIGMFRYFIKNSFKILRSKNNLIIRYGLLFLSFVILFLGYNFFYDMILNLYVMLMFFILNYHQSYLIKVGLFKISK
jgi:O-antigen ligase